MQNETRLRVIKTTLTISLKNFRSSLLITKLLNVTASTPTLPGSFIVHFLLAGYLNKYKGVFRTLSIIYNGVFCKNS